MKKALAICACIIGSPVAGNTWIGETNDGIHTALVSQELNEIMVMCDAGINAPVTSINFLIGGTVPEPLSRIRLEFDKSEPIFITADSEGGLGSSSPEDAQMFREVVELMKNKSSLKVRIFNGVSHTFALSGSSKAIGECTPDADRFDLALN